MPRAESFPSLGWFRRLADQLNADVTFRQLARWTSARIGFAVEGDPATVLTLVDGMIVAAEEGEGLRGVDYRLEGPREGWDVLFQERGNLALALNQLHGRLRVRGNIELAAGDNWTLANMCRRFRNVSEGGEPR